MAADDLITRDEALGGLPARRAASTLFLVESRAAYLADQSRQSGNFLVSEDAARRRDLAFLEALTEGREPPRPPTIADLERFAGQWAHLVPPGPAIRAGVAHMLGRKYAFTRAAVPRLRAALALDEAAVAEAYRRQYREDLGAIYAPRLGMVARLGMAWSALSTRVDTLPPFWLTFLLTLAFSFSQALLAVPTSVAGMGALPGLGLVVAVGLVNVLTMACMAEACARSGDFRYGRAFIGRLVTSYLGGDGALVFSLITVLRTFLVTLAASLGIALTLASATGVRAELWIVAVTAAQLYHLSRKSQNVTLAALVALTGLNLALVLLFVALAASRIDPANFLGARLAWHDGASAAPSPLGRGLGVIVMLYFGHVYVAQCARSVLPRDPSGRSLIRGSVAGTLALVATFGVWVIAVNGVVPAARLGREAATALPLLAERIGPVVQVLGPVLVVLLLGLASVRASTVLFNLVQERLPTRLSVVLTLPRRRGDLLFEPRGGADAGLHLGVRYLGLTDGQARLRVDVQHQGAVERTEVTVATRWDAAPLLARLRGAAGRADHLTLDVLDAQPDAVRVRVTTTLRVGTHGDWSEPERHPEDMAALDPLLRETATWLMRRGEATLAEVVRDRDERPEAARGLLDALVAQGFAERVHGGADPRYRIRLAPRRRRQVPEAVWAAPGPPTASPSGPGRGRLHLSLLSLRGLALSEAGRLVAATSPIVLVALLGEALLLTDSASFADVLGFSGVVANSITAGTFPVLLLAASRRKGDSVPGTVYRLLGHPAFTWSVYGLSVANLFLHGLVIYRDIGTRACALVLGVVVLGVTARILRRGAFARRAVVELREDPREGGAGVLAITSGGRPLAAAVTLGRPEGEERLRTAGVSVPALAKLREVTVLVPAGGADEVKVWAHRVTATGTSEALPALVEIRAGAATRRFDLRLSNGQAVVATGGADCAVRLTLDGADEA